jgi:hypothetical protein
MTRGTVLSTFRKILEETENLENCDWCWALGGEWEGFPIRHRKKSQYFQWKSTAYQRSKSVCDCQKQRLKLCLSAY